MKVINNLFLETGQRGRRFLFPGIVIKIAAVSFCLLLLTKCRDDEFDEDSGIDSVVRSALGEIRTDSLESYVKWLEGMGTRFALANNHRKVAVNIRNRFISMGYDGAYLDSFFISRTFRGITYDQWQYNVIALIRGTESPDSVCILGGHYDSIVGFGGDPLLSAPGAHDNASGTAAALEVARVLKQKQFAPRKSIMFIAFGAEELGLLGSNYFSLNPGEFEGRISFMLNNDMIGYDQDTNPSLWQVNILDYPGSEQLRIQAQKLIQKFTRIGYINDNTDSRRSDSYPFSLRGYKALFFSSVKTDPYYHSGMDVSTNINFEYCREITMISCALLMERNF